jgi:hypothetical protein
VQEGDTFERTIRGAIQDPGSSGELNFSIQDIVATGPEDVSISDNVTLNEDTGDPQTAEFTYTPDQDDDAGSPYEVTARITDSDLQTTADSTFTIEVVDDAQAPTTVADDADLTGDNALDEDDDGQANATVSFTATADDPNSDGDDLSFSINDEDVPFASFDPSSDVTVSGDDATATVALDPGFDDAGSYDLTATATDERTSASDDASIAVEVNDVAQAPVFADGGAPSDADATARDTARTPDDDDFTFDVTAESTDPGSAGSDLRFETDAEWAEAEVASTSGDEATATVTLEPGFAEAKASAEGTLDPVTVTVTDDAVGESADGAASVDVGYDPLLGNPTADTEAFGSLDAFAALAIAVGNPIEEGEENLDGQIRAADVTGATEGDTLDADPDDVNSFDALLMLQNDSKEELLQSQGSGTSVAAQASAKGQSGSDAIQIGEIDRKDGTAVVPVRLAEGATGVQAADVEVTLNSDVASVEDVQANTPEGWISSHSVNDEGVLTVGMAGTDALPSGKIATVRLSVSGNEEPFETGTYQVNGSDERDLSVETRPSEFALKSNYPNPVQTSTTIEYKLKEARSVTMEVYNTLGQKVATLVDEEKQAGSYSVNWEAGSQVSSGVYFYRIEAGDFAETKRITVVR